MSDFDVVIVSYRTPSLTANAARSAIESGAGSVLVIDNGSGDTTLEELDSMTVSGLRVVANERNVGFGQAANRMANLAKSRFLIFLNSDATLTGHAAAALTNELDTHGGRAIVGPRLLGKDDEVQPSAGLLPTPFDLTIRGLGLHHLARWLAGFRAVGPWVARSRTARGYDSARLAREPISTTMVSGACFAIGRQAFEQLGGFDESFFMYFEDADLCRRAAAAGMPIRYVPSAVVTHIGGASSPDDYHFGPLHARALRQYLGKWYGSGGSLLAVALLWLRALGFSVALRPGAKRAWRALWAAIRDEDPRR